MNVIGRMLRDGSPDGIKRGRGKRQLNMSIAHLLPPGQLRRGSILRYMALPQAHGVQQRWIEHLKRATQNFLSLSCFSHGLSHNDVISNKYTNIFELIKYQFVHFGRYLRNLNLRYYLNLLIH